jgi:hypothetical protein
MTGAWPDADTHAMPTLRTAYVQRSFEETPEYHEVCAISDRLMRHLNGSEAQELLAAANTPGQSSALVQASFGVFAGELGFTNEAKGLFAGYENAALRPDYYLGLDGTGILMEVERGKTTINNMDFLDFWKCHLCEHANYLFPHGSAGAPAESNDESQTRVQRPWPSAWGPSSHNVTTRTSAGSTSSPTEKPSRLALLLAFYLDLP